MLEGDHLASNANVVLDYPAHDAGHDAPRIRIIAHDRFLLYYRGGKERRSQERGAGTVRANV